MKASTVSPVSFLLVLGAALLMAGLFMFALMLMNGPKVQTCHADPADPAPPAPPFRFEMEVCDTINDSAGAPCINIVLFHDKVTSKKFMFVRSMQGGVSVTEFQEPPMKAEKP